MTEVVVVVPFVIALAQGGDWPGIRSFERLKGPFYEINRAVNLKRCGIQT